MQLISSDVLVAAPDYNLTTLRSVKMEYDVRVTDQDAYLESQITRVSSQIAAYCNRIFALQTYRDTFYHSRHSSGRLPLFLAQRPIIPGTVVVMRDDTTLAETTEYRVNCRTGTIHMWSGWGVEISVVYDAGWILPGWEVTSGSGSSADPLPPAVENAALAMVLASRQSGRNAWTDRDPFVRSETVEGVGTVQYGQSALGSASSGASGAIAATAAGLLGPFITPIVA